MSFQRSTRFPIPRNVALRWTPALAQSFTPVSDFFLDHYSRLTPTVKITEAMFVIQLMRYKWNEAAPFPAFKTIARSMGISDSAARGLARSLEQKGYLQRQMQVGQTNRFHLNKLFTALEALKELSDNEIEDPAAGATGLYQPSVHG